MSEYSGNAEAAAGARKAYGAMLDDLSALPIRFAYGPAGYSGFPRGVFHEISRETKETQDRRNDVITLRADGNLLVTVDMSLYPQYGAYEWTVRFSNCGDTNTEIIRVDSAADLTLAGDAPVLRGIYGDHENFYRPYVYDLSEKPVCFDSKNGRPTHIYFPYFNVEHGGGGTLIALGWGGTWKADFEAAPGGVKFRGTGCTGLETYLKPGEGIRTALVAVIPYAPRDADHAVNLWRSWYINCSMPKKDAAGGPLAPFSTCFFANDTGLPNSDGSISERHFTWKPSLEKMLAEGVRPDYRWFDAGWYCDPNGDTVETDWWGTVGAWRIDPVKWPGDSFRKSVDAFHEADIKTLVWFEPERVTNVAGLAANFGYRKEWGIDNGKGVVSNNIGDDDCLNWTLGRITGMMDENAVDLYREDNNSDQASCWAIQDAAEGAGRRGISENKCVCGHYKLWDGILSHSRARGRDTFLDSCASGGGRNDLESMRRAVPFLRSDSDRTTTSLRLSMTTGFNAWIPFNGAATTEQAGELDPDGKRDKYILRASYNPIFNISAQWTQDPGADFEIIRFGLAEWKSINAYLLKDFYLLTDWRDRNDRSHWTAFAYHDPIDGGGVLLAFRMEECGQAECAIKLRMLSPGCEYELADADFGPLGAFGGAALRDGYTITRAQPRSSALIRYSVKKG